DEIIVFRQLTREEVMQVADLMLDEVNRRLEERQMTIQVTDAVKQRLIQEGYDQRYGARPMRRAIARIIEDTLAEEILSGAIQDGDTVLLDLDEDGQLFASSEREPALVGSRP
ncbi:ATP-dependent Clp protease ATP-binding subunit ClpC, partial [filamentous cyanobacterium CCP5]